MSADLAAPKTGELSDQSFEYKDVRWKIHNISSSPVLVDYEIQSPTFSFAGATWILGMYPYGRTSSGTRGNVDFVIERLHSNLYQKELFLKVYFETQDGTEFQPLSSLFNINTISKEGRKKYFMPKVEISRNLLAIASNNTLNIVFQMRTMKMDVCFGTPTLLDDKTFSKSSVGNISEVSYDFKEITWKIPNALSILNSINYRIHSPTFSFAGDTWLLQVYPYGRKSQGYLDVMMKRLHSQISRQEISFKIYLKTRKGKEYLPFTSKCSFNSVINVGGVKQYLKHSEFYNNKTCVTSNEVLTVVFQVWVKKNNTINSQSEIEKPVTDVYCDSKLPEIQHSNKVLSDLKELYLNQEDCDVVINVKGFKFPTHKIILKARSSVFASALRSDMTEKATGIINIEDCNPYSFRAFLCFLYCGSVEIISVENVFHLFTTADKYDVQDLRLECVEFMKNNLSVDTFCDIMSLALRHSETRLTVLTTDFFAKNVKKIIVTSKWQAFLAQNPVESNELLINALGGCTST